MLSLLLLIIVIWHFYIGYSRGIFLQVFYVLMSMVSLMIASQFYQELASQITLWVPYSNPVQGVEVYFFKDISKFQLSHVYYAGVAFVFIYSLSYLVGRLLGVLLHLAPVEHFD
ncbi:CvpA family protein, partial [Streptococcus agalactiae]|nr:CvpA family protein [Streptococcus agalactiae]MCC9976420.1 CvpA family protein [Streptococcus agalactiae]